MTNPQKLPMPDQAMARVLILGSGQDGSAPQFGGPPVSIDRTASSILVTGPSGTSYLFDASPDLRIQGIRAGLDPQMLGGVFLTHAHMGHYVGLAQFGNEAAATDAVPCFGTASMHEYLSRNEPWRSLFTRRHLEFNVVTPGVEVRLEEFLSVTAHLVPHRPDFSDTVGFVVNNLATGGSVLYLPDIDRWDAWDAATEVVDSVTMAFLDASFSSRDELPGRAMGEFPHPLVAETIARFRSSPSQIVLTHINHSNPLGIVGETSTQDAANAGFLIARDGDEYEF
jgi:pyrroloquinoline quinone biosynthesis protein B